MNWIALENEIRDVTAPSDQFYRYQPTGKQKAWLFGIRVPVRLVRWIITRRSA